MSTSTIFSLAALGSLAGTQLNSAAYAGEITANISPPALDRWMYPFGPAGPRATASLYTTIGSSIEGFDDRDAQYLLGFDTSPTIPAARPISTYRIISATLTARVTVDDGAPGFVFDPTSDPATSSLAAGDPAQTADPDAGKPIELFACAYRGNHPTTDEPWSALNYVQTSPFSTLEPIGFARGNRAVYPIDFDSAGLARDVSNNVTDLPRFDPRPLAVGQASGVLAGATVPNNTAFVFSIDLTKPGVEQYLRQGLSIGRINLLVTSLHNAQDFGSGPVVYPVFATRFNPLATPASLQITVSLCTADIADDQGTPLAQSPGNVPNSGVNEGDYNAFFAADGFFFQSSLGPAGVGLFCDIADDQGNPLPPAPGVSNNGVNEGDYNAFFNNLFLPCP
ncbi:MAG: hypothetical protein IBJ18_13185 [Phycisphaerales bacterium]|nr:hypothetical protein [Phycisphaerales bacterium]